MLYHLYLANWPLRVPHHTSTALEGQSSSRVPFLPRYLLENAESELLLHARAKRGRLSVPFFFDRSSYPASGFCLVVVVFVAYF